MKAAFGPKEAGQNKGSNIPKRLKRSIFGAWEGV
jgi:hypothetical protein